MARGALRLGALLALVDFAGAGWTPSAPRAPSQSAQLWEGSLAQTTRYLPDDERALTFQALQMATRVHQGQKRRDGSPFVTHPVAVANLVAGWGMDSQCVVAALLHDAVEDTPLTFGEIEDVFGSEVRTLVQGVTRVSKLPQEKVVELEKLGMGALCQESGDLLQLLDACAGDWRVAVLKVADRLHNMRTLSAMKPHKRARKAQETAKVFVPLAHYLGAHDIGHELAQLSRRHESDDQPRQSPRHQLWAAAERVRSAVLFPSLSAAAQCLGLGDRSPLDAMRFNPSSERLRLAILQLDDADRAHNLMLRLQPLRERFARHQYVHMGATALAEEATPRPTALTRSDASD